MEFKFDSKTLSSVLDTAEKITSKLERAADAAEKASVAVADVVEVAAEASERVIVAVEEAVSTTMAAVEAHRGPQNVTVNNTFGDTDTSPEALKRVFQDAVNQKAIATFRYPTNLGGTTESDTTSVRRIQPTSVTETTVYGVDLDIEAFHGSATSAIRQFRFDRIDGTVKVSA